MLINRRSNVILRINVYTVNLLSLRTRLTNSNITRSFRFSQVHCRVAVQHLNFNRNMNTKLRLSTLQLVPLACPNLHFRFNTVVRHANRTRNNAYSLHALRILLKRPRLLIFKIIHINSNRALNLQTNSIHNMTTRHVFTCNVRSLLTVLMSKRVNRHTIIPPISGHVRYRTLVNFLSIFRRVRNCTIETLLILIINIIPYFFGTSQHNFKHIHINTLFNNDQAINIMLRIDTLQIMPTRHHNFSNRMNHNFTISFRQRSHPLRIVILIKVRCTTLPISFHVVNVTINLTMRVRNSKYAFTILIIVIIPYFHGDRQHNFQYILHLRIASTITANRVFTISNSNTIFTSRGSSQVRSLMSIQYINFNRLMPSKRRFRHFHLTTKNNPYPVKFRLQQSSADRLRNNAISKCANVHHVRLYRLRLRLHFIIITTIPAMITRYNHLTITIFNCNSSRFTTLPICNGNFIIMSSIMYANDNLHIVSKRCRVRQDKFLMLQVDTTKRFTIQAYRLNSLVCNIMIRLRSIKRSIKYSYNRLLNSFFTGHAVTNTINVNHEQRRITSNSTFRFRNNTTHQLTRVTVHMLMSLRYTLIMFRTTFTLLRNSNSYILQNSTIILVPNRRSFITTRQSRTFT